MKGKERQKLVKGGESVDCSTPVMIDIIKGGISELPTLEMPIGGHS